MEKKRLHGRHSSLRAFTTLELLVTLGILAVVMGLSFTFFQGYKTNGNLRSAAGAMATDFAELKQRAMTGDLTIPGPEGVRIHRLALNLAANQYSLQRCTAPDNPCPAWEEIQVKRLSQYGRDIAFVPGGTTPLVIEFQTRGTVTPATIVLANGRGSRANIHSNISGRIYVEFAMQ